MSNDFFQKHNDNVKSDSSVDPGCTKQTRAATAAASAAVDDDDDDDDDDVELLRLAANQQIISSICYAICLNVMTLHANIICSLLSLLLTLTLILILVLFLLLLKRSV
jgi:hypothetical protein